MKHQKYKSLKEMKEKDFEYYQGYVCGMFIGFFAILFCTICFTLIIFFRQYEIIILLFGFLFYGFLSLEILIWRINKAISETHDIC